MADSEQQDISDGLIHIYECDEQQVSALIVPTDGQIRGNLPVSIEDAESDTVYTTTITDAYGMINTTLSLSPGTYVPIIKCGNNIKNIYEGGVVCHACSLTLTSDKDILSAADNDVATLTATLTGTESGYNGPLSGREITFEVRKQSDDSLVETLTGTTNSSGIATVSYLGKGAGDLNIKAECMFVSESFVVYDYPYYSDNMQKIKNSFIVDTSVSGRTIYLSPFTFNSDVELEFKFKNTPPASWVIGFGSDGSTYNGKGAFFRLQGYNSNKNSIMWVTTSGGSTDASLNYTIDENTILKISTENIHHINWYIGSSYVAYRDTHTGTPLGLRLDVFNNIDYEIEYIKVKPL